MERHSPPPMSDSLSLDVENTKAQMRKGLLEFAVLLLISQGEAYASGIIKELQRSELLVVEGTLYPLLNRLKTVGLLSYSWQESASGPPRKYYALTSSGKDAIGEFARTWKSLATPITSLLRSYEKSH